MEFPNRTDYTVKILNLTPKLCSLKKQLIREAYRLKKKKKLHFATEHRDWTLFQSDWSVRVREAVDEVLHLSCPQYKRFGSAMFPKEERC